jgi:UDPglucose--hexose-1-phosphate uridylyltransferase
VLIAPGRGRRPGVLRPEAAGEDQTECPFCEGREDRTPPESYVAGPPCRAPNTPGWEVRVVPNLYPAVSGSLGRQEVVVHAPRHARSLADLSADDLGRVATAWRSRAEEARTAGFRYLHAFVNEGREAGASLAHSHSQLVWLPEPPPVALVEWERAGGRCRLCEVIADERASGTRVVLERDGLAVCSPYAARVPYELVIAPLACEADGLASARLPQALALLGEAVAALRALEGPAPLNAWLHTSPLDRERGHWHIELLPRLSVPAGLELGAGLLVNVLPPEDAAAALRSSW